MTLRTNPNPPEVRPELPKMPAPPKIDSTGSAAVDKNYHWQPITSCPHGVKVQLRTKYGVALYGQYWGDTDFYTHWAPCPTIGDK